MQSKAPCYTNEETNIITSQADHFILTMLFFKMRCHPGYKFLVSNVLVDEGLPAKRF